MIHGSWPIPRLTPKGCCDWNKHISAGEGAVVILLGKDRKQAAILRKYCHGLIEKSPLLAAEVVRSTQDTIDFKNGGSLKIITNNSGPTDHALQSPQLM